MSQCDHCGLDFRCRLPCFAFLVAQRMVKGQHKHLLWGREAFQEFDTSGDGFIGKDELCQLFGKLGKSLTKKQACSQGLSGP